MSHILAIAVIVLTPILWILSHKFFKFIYFGNIANSIIKEILECFFISLLLVSIVGAIFGKLLSFIGRALLFLLKAALVIAAVCFVIWLISVIVKKVKQEKIGSDTEEHESSAEIESLPVEAAEVEGSNEADIPDRSFSNVALTPNKAESDMISYIREHFSKENYIQAVRYYREQTGTDFAAAQEALKEIFDK